MTTLSRIGWVTEMPLTIRIMPAILIGPAIGQFRQGEDGMGITILVFSGVMTIIFALIEDNAERKRNERR